MVMFFVIDNAELSWCHPMNLLFGMYHKRVISRPLQRRRMILWRMTYLECHLTRCLTLCEIVEVTNSEILLVSRFRVIAMRNIENIQLHILLHHEPGTSTKAHTLALADGMKPETFMLANALASL